MPGNWNSGKRPNPTKLQQLRGNPGRRRLPVDEPQPAAAPVEFDQVPEEFADTPAAAAEWSRVVPLLRQAGIISSVERHTLIALCQQWAIYQRATKAFWHDGALLVGKNGVPYLNRNFQVQSVALEAWRRLASELGMSPGSRARLTRLKAADQPASATEKWADAF